MRQYSLMSNVPANIDAMFVLAFVYFSVTLARVVFYAHSSEKNVVIFINPVTKLIMCDDFGCYPNATVVLRRVFVIMSFL